MGGKKRAPHRAKVRSSGRSKQADINWKAISAIVTLVGIAMVLIGIDQQSPMAMVGFLIALIGLIVLIPCLTVNREGDCRDKAKGKPSEAAPQPRTGRVIAICLGIALVIVVIGLLLGDATILAIGLVCGGTIIAIGLLCLIIGPDHPIWDKLNSSDHDFDASDYTGGRSSGGSSSGSSSFGGGSGGGGCTSGGGAGRG